MTILIPGDKSNAICYHCASMVPTTFKLRDMPFSDCAGFAPNVLANVCDHCDSILSIPAQCTPGIQEARNRIISQQYGNGEIPSIF